MIAMPPIMTNDQLITAIVQIESQGNVNAIGDKGLKNHAYGILQIRQPCLDDFNNWNGTELVVEDLLGESGAVLSKTIFLDYMKHYATEEKIGRPPTPVDKARIWSGGPKGWKRDGTLSYAAKFDRITAEYA